MFKDDEESLSICLDHPNRLVSSGTSVKVGETDDKGNAIELLRFDDEDKGSLLELFPLDRLLTLEH